MRVIPRITRYITDADHAAVQPIRTKAGLVGREVFLSD